ncbi:MAG: hypothetical protein R2852_06720 [Bacteroidia bacterium]
MKQFSLNFKWIPEFYFILVAILWYYLSTRPFVETHEHFVNFPAVLMILLFHIQLFLNDQILGKLLAGLVTIANIYLTYTLLTSWIDFYQFDQSSKILLLQMGNLILMNLIMSYFMYKKYDSTDIASSELFEVSKVEND